MSLTLTSMSNLDTASERSSGQPYSATRAFRRNSVGSAGIFPKAPTMGHHSTIHKRPRSSYDTQTSALSQTPHKQNAIPNLTAKATSLQLYPIKDLPSPQQLREGLKWYPPFQDHTEEREDKLYFQSQDRHPSMIPEHPQSSYDAQTSALNETPHEKNAIPNLTARDASSLPDPIKDLPSPQEILEPLEAKWHQRFRELQDKYYLAILECKAKLYRSSNEWLERFEKKNQELREISVENAILIDAVLYQITETMIFKENFNVRGALERMVHHAKLAKKIGADCPPEIQAGLNELAKTPAFTKVLHDEVASRGLEPEAVTPCIALVYDKVFQHAHGNDYIITLYEEGYTAGELAVLAAFLRMQSEWPQGLRWREEKRKR